MYGSKNIRVNMVSPGPVKNNQNPKLLEEIENMTPMGRLGKANEVAQAVLFLADESGSYITAQTLHINGGMYTI